MTIHDTVRTTVMCLTLATTASQGVADERPDGRRGPPPQAIEACANLSEGDACTFNGRNDEELTGVCFAPSDAELACKPEGHDRRRGGNSGNRPDRPGDDQTL